MKLARDVRQYYLENLSSLPLGKQFHFVSRLGSWSQDPECLEILKSLKEQMLPSDMPPKEVLSDIMQNLPDTPINAAAARAPYFAKYPELRGRMLALFRVRHLLFLYDTDVRHELTELVSYDELHRLSRELADDADAIRVLSTYAINYLYLVEHILFDVHSGVLAVEQLYGLGNAYDTGDKDDTLLLIYLYTHCIIGESNFYERAVIGPRLETYTRMLRKLDDVIRQHFDDINLDNKLEFLVCCRILAYETDLFERIYDECSRSVSPDGTFLVDTVNHAAQSKKTTLATSEHRNVLFIMSTSEYTRT